MFWPASVRLATLPACNWLMNAVYGKATLGVAAGASRLNSCQPKTASNNTDQSNVGRTERFFAGGAGALCAIVVLAPLGSPVREGHPFAQIPELASHTCLGKTSDKWAPAPCPFGRCRPPPALRCWRERPRPSRGGAVLGA